MTLTAAAIKIMAEKGLTAHDLAEIAAANEKRADPTAAARQARRRARKVESQRDVTRDPPNDNSSNPPVITPKPDGLAPSQKSKSVRGSRLPDDWRLPDEWRQWATERRGWSGVEIDEEAEIFANYWQAKSGAGACHVSWAKTWKNWVIRSHRPNGTRQAAKAAAPMNEEQLRSAIRFRRDIGDEAKAQEYETELAERLAA